MVWVDYLFIIILLFSAGFGFLRGMFKEVLSLLTWIGAYIIAQSFWPALDYLLKPLMDEVPSIRAPLAWGVLFVSSILVGSLIQRIVLELVRVTGLSGSDRALGGIFGMLRGVVIIVLLLTFVPLVIDLSHDIWWEESILIPVFSAFKNSVMLAITSLVELIQGFKIG
jgi:membrane protein required for colicin V production